MNTKEKLESALKDAMRASDDLRKRTLRMALSAIRFNEINQGAALDEEAVISALQKEVKSRRESIEEAQRAGRADLEAAAEDEIRVLQEFLPESLSGEELEALAREAVEEVGASSPKEMGKVMKVLMPRVQGRATGDQVSQAVRRLLQ